MKKIEVRLLGEGVVIEGTLSEVNALECPGCRRWYRHHRALGYVSR
jgi:hypothetical protein